MTPTTTEPPLPAPSPAVSDPLLDAPPGCPGAACNNVIMISWRASRHNWHVPTHSCHDDSTLCSTACRLKGPRTLGDQTAASVWPHCASVANFNCLCTVGYSRQGGSAPGWSRLRNQSMGRRRPTPTLRGQKNVANQVPVGWRQEHSELLLLAQC